MATTTASFIDTFSETTAFTKDQVQEWAKNAAEAGSKSPTLSDSDNNSDSGTKSSRKKRKTKQKRGENQPKRPMSGYMLFLNENRAAIKTTLLEDNEKVSVGDIAKVGGAQWKALGDEDKAKFTEQSEKLKTEYAAAMETWRTEHPEEAEAPKEKKPKKTKQAKEAKEGKSLKKTFTPGDAPEAPPGMTGPFSGYLAKTAKNADGKSSFKDFTEAIAAAMELGDDCGGVTRTTRGWSLRKAVTLGTDGKADRKEISYIKSQFVSEELAKQVGVTEEPQDTASETESVPEPVQTEEKPKKKRGRPSKKPVAKEPESVAKEPEPVAKEPEPVVEPVVDEAGGKSDYEAETEGEAETDEHQPVYSEDEVETISWEFKGKDYELDEQTGKVYAEDEDGEYELVGYRKVREVEVVTKKGKKMKKEVYIDEPWKN